MAKLAVHGCLSLLCLLVSLSLANSQTLDYDENRNRFRGNSFLYNTQDSNAIINEAGYFIVASRFVHPGQIYRVTTTILNIKYPVVVKASIHRNEVEIAAASLPISQGSTESLILRVPPTSVSGSYKLRVEGFYNTLFGGSAFLNETALRFSQRSMTVFIQTDRPIYMQGQKVNFRAIPINTALNAYANTIDVYMLDPHGYIMRRWLSRQSNLGTVSLSYQLSDQPKYGNWSIRVVALGQIEEHSFQVEEYYPYRFEVNVTMPAFFFTTDPYIYGTVMANYTSGAPVHGNLTLKATIQPIKSQMLNRQLETYNTVERYLNFEEEYPFWFLPVVRDQYTVPHLKYFNGVYNFKYPMSEIEKYVPTLDGMELTITATVGDRFLDEVITGFSMARVYNSSVRLRFVGGSPQVFKSPMPFPVRVAVSYHDGSPLPRKRLEYSRVEISGEIIMKSKGRRSLDFIHARKSVENLGIWEVDVDIGAALGLDVDKASSAEFFNDIDSVKLTGYYSDNEYTREQAELLLLAHYSPNNHFIKVTTSTHPATVGEYIIFHVHSNFYMESFHYIIKSKGNILLNGEEQHKNSISTFAIALSSEMAPVATVLVYYIGKYGEIAADSLTFPVNGISRNNFTLFINNRKARTGKKVEVAIYGEPGSHVGLSGVDRALYEMHGGSDISYARVISKMADFGDDLNSTSSFAWVTHSGDPDNLVYYPTSSFGIDAKRVFEYAGLIVFSDIEVTRRVDLCTSQGLSECLNGRCFRSDRKCDGRFDCEDGTDEAGCPERNSTDLQYFRKYRISRTQRLYESTWLWKDINIGAHGRYIFEVDVPQRPTHWMVSAFGMSSTYGFGLLHHPIEYVGVLPFYINVEMPEVSHQGEQIGVRVTVFNYMTNNIEAVVVLSGSDKYKFVHVEMNGIVRSYNPRTSFGEHQFFVYIKAQDAAVVYLPIVPVVLGDVPVTVMASTLIGKDSITKNLHVLADGLPQLRHQSIMLDLRTRSTFVQYMHVNVTDTPIIPYDEERYYVFGSNKAHVSVVGDVVGPIFPTMPVNATSLLNLPMDGAEQTVFGFAANLYNTWYMRLINARNQTQENNAFFYMNLGYQRAMTFMNPDGSFSLFRSDWNHSSPSVWLTAFCVRIFQAATFYEWENYIYIDPQVISKSIYWLLSHQTESGSFYEVTWLPDRKMNSSFRANDSSLKNVSLTAHVVITLDSVKDLSAGLGSLVALARDKAVDWLSKRLSSLEQYGEPYEIAIVAYALMLSKHSEAETAYRLLIDNVRSEGGLMYWGKIRVPPPPTKNENQKPFLLPRLPYEHDASNIETTAFGLLVYVARQENDAELIVKWLNSQRLTDGGWASTQDTVWAMVALIEYTNRNRLRDVSGLTVRVDVTALRAQPKVLRVNNQNLAHLQRIDIPHAWGTVKVEAKGAGYAILQMSVQYNVDIPKFQTQPPVKAFSLVTRAVFHGRNQSHITYNSCQRWTHINESVRSGLAVLDVTIPTGYIIQQQRLDEYVLAGNTRNLNRARFLDRKVLFYFNFLDETDTCINFTIERWYPVANMSRYLPVKVYDFYAPERFNETIFDALPTYVLNICEVCGSSQCPYCPIYNSAAVLGPSIILIFFITFRHLFPKITKWFLL